MESQPPLLESEEARDGVNGQDTTELSRLRNGLLTKPLRSAKLNYPFLRWPSWLSHLALLLVNFGFFCFVTMSLRPNYSQCAFDDGPW